MPVIAEKKRGLSFNRVLAAAKKLSAEEKHLLKLKLFGKDIINELMVFEKEMKKKKPLIKKSDDEIVAAVKKIRARHARK